MSEKFKDMPHLNKIMREMCKRAGAHFDKIDFKKRDWFTRYSWTESEQEDFKKWFIGYLMKSRKARDELLEIPIKNLERIKKAASWFLLDYGWKLKREILKESKAY